MAEKKAEKKYLDDRPWARSQQEYRCQGCGKKLFEGGLKCGVIRVLCSRCGCFNVFMAEQKN